MSNESSSPFGFTVSTTKSDGRTWLHLKRSDGASAALSCQTSTSNGETIISQVVTEFADALEGGATVTEALASKIDAEWRKKGGLNCTEVCAIIRSAALSAPAQRVEEGWKLVPVEPFPEMIGAWWRQKNTGCQEPGQTGDQTSDYDAYRAMLAASPAPAPHAGVATDKLHRLVKVWGRSDRRDVMLPFLGSGTCGEVADIIRAALGDRT